MKKIGIYIFVIFVNTTFAQIGGTKVFRFLDLQIPARSAALGGATNAIWDDDVNLSYKDGSGLETQKGYNYSGGYSGKLFINNVNS